MGKEVGDGVWMLLGPQAEIWGVVLGQVSEVMVEDNVLGCGGLGTTNNVTCAARIQVLHPPPYRG